MEKSQFDEIILTETQSVQTEDDIDIGKEIDEYLNYLNRLYDSIKDWLKDYTEKERINITEVDYTLIEDLTGPYHTKKMEIYLGAKKFTLLPKGTFLAGVKGRVDFESSKDRIKIGLCDEKLTEPHIQIFNSEKEKQESEAKKEPQKINWLWKVITDPPRIQFITLDRNVFYDIFAKLIYG